MNIAQQYFQQQLSDTEFRHAYLEEKAKVGTEDPLEEFKEAIRTSQHIEGIIQKIDRIEQYVMAV